MKFIRKQPKKELNSVIKSYWKLEIEPQDIPYKQLFFPYGSFELISYIQNKGVMNYIGEGNLFEQPQLFYSGQFTKPFFLTFQEPCICFGVSIKPWASNALFDIPSNEFTDKMINLVDIDKSFLIDNEHLNSSDSQIFEELERYLLKKINYDKVDSVSSYLASTIINSLSRVAVNLAISKIGMSRRRIEQRFLASTGLTIGSFTRKIRFQAATQLLCDHNVNTNLTKIGVDLGYYDQSHFTSEFKEFTSISPLTYLKQKNDLANFLVTLSKNP